MALDMKYSDCTFGTKDAKRRDTMPSPKKKEIYSVMRTDNTSVLYEWTREEFTNISLALTEEKKFASFKDGILSLVHIRAIVRQDVPKEDKKQLPSGTPELDVVTAHWLKQQEDMIKALELEENDELEGGRFS
jgi:hypothetical protein